MQLMTLRTANGRAAGGESFSGYSGGGRSPIGIGGAIAVHAVVIGAWLLMPKEVIDVFRDPPLVTYTVPETQPPKPEPLQTETGNKPRPQPKSRPTVAEKPVVATQPDDFRTTGDDHPSTGTDAGTGTGTLPDTPIIGPVLVEATIDPRTLPGFQPDYPGTMIRQGMEGKVTVRVTIGPDGRVAAIERITATNEAFWLATQRHALRKWRFRPATRDGVAISSSKILTVRFSLTDI